jgi:hypothetical protein
MATHGEIRWPPARTFNGRLRGDSHGRRHAAIVTRRREADDEKVPLAQHAGVIRERARRSPQN